MNMPHFTADASLYTSSRTYQLARSPGRSGAMIQPAVYVPLDYPVGVYVWNFCIAECGNESETDWICVDQCFTRWWLEGLGFHTFRR